jgi:hypothetical protein
LHLLANYFEIAIFSANELEKFSFGAIAVKDSEQSPKIQQFSNKIKRKAVEIALISKRLSQGFLPESNPIYFSALCWAPRPFNNNSKTIVPSLTKAGTT